MLYSSHVCVYFLSWFRCTECICFHVNNTQHSAKQPPPPPPPHPQTFSRLRFYFLVCRCLVVCRSSVFSYSLIFGQKRRLSFSLWRWFERFFFSVVIISLTCDLIVFVRRMRKASSTSPTRARVLSLSFSGVFRIACLYFQFQYIHILRDSLSRRLDFLLLLFFVDGCCLVVLLVVWCSIWSTEMSVLDTNWDVCHWKREQQ